jgi:hypothetical protein
MTYVMTKPCPICKRQLTKQEPTDSVTALAENMSAGLRPRPGDINVKGGEDK